MIDNKPEKKFRPNNKQSKLEIDCVNLKRNQTPAYKRTSNYKNNRVLSMSIAKESIVVSFFEA